MIKKFVIVALAGAVGVGGGALVIESLDDDASPPAHDHAAGETHDDVFDEDKPNLIQTLTNTSVSRVPIEQSLDEIIAETPDVKAIRGEILGVEPGPSFGGPDAPESSTVYFDPVNPMWVHVLVKTTDDEVVRLMMWRPGAASADQLALRTRPEIVALVRPATYLHKGEKLAELTRFYEATWEEPIYRLARGELIWTDQVAPETVGGETPPPSKHPIDMPFIHGAEKDLILDPVAPSVVGLDQLWQWLEERV